MAHAGGATAAAGKPLAPDVEDRAGAAAYSWPDGDWAGGPEAAGRARTTPGSLPAAGHTGKGRAAHAGGQPPQEPQGGVEAHGERAAAAAGAGPPDGGGCSRGEARAGEGERSASAGGIGSPEAAIAR